MLNRSIAIRVAALGASFVFAIAGVSFLCGNKIHAAGSVKVDQTNFPDEVFRNYVLERFDYNLPYGELDEEELERADTIDITDNKNLTSLKGIKLLPNIRCVYVNGCSISSVDLSANTKIETLSISDNKLDSLNVSALTSLCQLFCKGNNIKSLDLSHNPEIYWLDVSKNKISSIDLSNLSELLEFRCEECKSLKSLDLSNNSKLTLLSCNGCGLNSIKFGNNPDLKDLYAGQNNLTKLDVSTFKKLQYIYIADCNISSLDLTNNPELISFTCYQTSITELDFSKCTKLQTLDCDNNKLKSLKVSNCSELVRLSCPNNQIKKLDLKNCGKLEQVMCYDNQISSITLPVSDTLYNLRCYNNKLTKLNISSCKLLVQTYKKGNRTDYTDQYLYDYYDGTNAGTLYYDSNIKIITDGNIEPTDTPTPTPTAVADIYDDSSVINVKAGKKVRIDASVLGSKPYNWSSSDKTIATVDSNGYVTGKKAGTVTITVTKGAKKLTCKVKVTGSSSTATPTPKPDPNTTTAKPVFVVCGKSVSFDVKSIIGSGTYTWKSSDSKIASVDSKGVVNTLMAGNVNITVTCGKKKHIQPVTVLYKDVTNSKDFWYEPTNYLTAKNVVKGYDKQTKFKPANDCTRAQMVTFLYRLQGEPKTQSTTCKFKDVKKTDYFFKPVIWAVEKGITTGVSKTKFDPQGVCTRAQTVTFLWRMAKKPDPKSTKNNFKDVKTTDYFYKATLWASEKKILAGYSDGTFKPKGKCLRRQMVTFLYKYDKYVNGKG